jgi:hypothetical protein
MVFPKMESYLKNDNCIQILHFYAEMTPGAGKGPFDICSFLPGNVKAGQWPGLI